MDTYFTEINHVLLASRGYEYDGFLDFLNSIVFISFFERDLIVSVPARISKGQGAGPEKGLFSALLDFQKGIF